MMLLGLGAAIRALAVEVGGGSNPFAQTRTVYALGNNEYGQLGPTHPTDPYPRYLVKILENVDPVEVPQIACTSVGVTGNVRLADNSVWTWGGDAASTWSGRSGIWPPAPVEEPPTGGHWAQISQGAGYVAFLSSLGHLYTGGISSSYRLGTGSNAAVPTIAKIAENIAKVACGGQFGHAIKTDGSVVSWGRNSSGQTSQGSSSSSSYTMTPTLVSTTGTTPALANIVDVRATSYAAYLLASDGNLWATGEGSLGQQGDGDAIDNLRYSYISNGWRYVSAGEFHVVALKTDNTLWAWGDGGTMGRYDAGMHTTRSVPAQVGTDDDWLDCYALGEGSLLRKTNGDLYYCGGPMHWGETVDQYVQIGTLSPDDVISNGKYNFFVGRK